jgi:multiple antibiotic resistance protein
VAVVPLAIPLLANPIVHILGKTGINIATRLMGLLLGSIAIEFITGGLAALLPGLAG